VKPSPGSPGRFGACEPDLLQTIVKTMAEAPMSAEVDAMCGAGYGERLEERTNRRNEYRERVAQPRTRFDHPGVG
jgi:transposase-like protein